MKLSFFTFYYFLRKCCFRRKYFWFIFDLRETFERIHYLFCQSVIMYVIRSQCNLAGSWSRLLILRIYDMVKVKSTSTLFLLLLKIYCKQRKNAICGKNFIHLMYRNLNLYLHSSNVTFPADFSVLLMLLWMFMFCFW